MKILSVDDNYANLYFMEALLAGSGHQVVSVHNGVEALRELENTVAAKTGPEENGFDLIVSDVLMPEMDGFRLCREVKSNDRFKRIPFVIYTATYTSKQDEDFGRSLGASRFIVKPIEPEDLVAILEDVYDSRKEEESHEPAPAGDEEYLRVYNQRLIKKLERKLEQLEGASRDLKRLVLERDREIDRRTSAEAELRRSEEQLRLVWENSIDGMLVTAADGMILRANPAFARMCGRPLPTLERTHFKQCGWTDPDNAFAAYDQRPGKENGLPPFEQRLRRADGSEVLLEATSTPFESRGTRVSLGVFRDITARRHAEEAQAALENQLAESRKMETVGRLAGGIAHDFNNLLTVINGYCDLLRMATVPGSESYRIAEQIEKAGRSSAELTSQLLAFSRGQEIVDAPINLNSLITEGLPLLQRLLGEHIEIVTRLDPALDLVMGDAGQFLQVIMNLAANARDAMPDTGTLTLTTTNVPAGSKSPNSGQFVSLEVSDTGSGIPEAVMPHIFDPFFTTKDKDGTGLGLFTVSGIVRRTGGTITARNGRPTGTVFEILMPRAAPAPAVPSREPEIERPADNPQGRGETILVTEDRDEVRDLVVATLRHFGYEVLSASCGKEALATSAAHTGPIDLLLTDVLMPEMSGRQLAAYMKASRPSVRVLFMSGMLSGPVLVDDPADAVSATEEYLMKPFTVQTLTTRVRELLNRNRMSAAGAGKVHDRT
jgi:PAS domain S-box-containing protein